MSLDLDVFLEQYEDVNFSAFISGLFRAPYKFKYGLEDFIVEIDTSDYASFGSILVTVSHDIGDYLAYLETKFRTLTQLDLHFQVGMNNVKRAEYIQLYFPESFSEFLEFIYHLIYLPSYQGKIEVLR